MSKKVSSSNTGVVECDERSFFRTNVETPAGISDLDLQTLHAPIAIDETALLPDFTSKQIIKPKSKKLTLARLVAVARTQVEIEVANDTPFLMIPILLIAGAATYFSLPTEPAAHNIPVALALSCIVRIVCMHASVALKYALNAVLIFTFAMALGQFQTSYIGTQMLGSEISTRLTGQIRNIEQRANGSVRYTIDVQKTERPTLLYAPDRVRATSRKPLETAQIGGIIHGYVRLSPPSGPARPGAFDFAFHNYFEGIGANGFFLGQPQMLPTTGENSIVDRIILGFADVRLWLATRIRGYDQSSAGAVSAALITGDKAAIPEEINEVLRVAGLAHILSISGLHMALVAGTIMFSIRLGFALFPNSASKRPTKKIAAIAGFAAISIYLFLSGASVATQRSFIMLAVMLGALLGDRAALTMRNLAIAAIVVILIAPEAVLGPSFQMSFSATLALIAAFGTWQKRSISEDSKLAPGLAQQITKKSVMFLGGLSMTSIIAGTATGIFAAYHFQRVAVLGLLGNLLAMPIVSLITMPSAILATLLIPVGLDGYVFSVMNWSVALVETIAAKVSAIAPSGATGAMTPTALVLMTTAMFMLCLLKSKLKYAAFLILAPLLFIGIPDERPVVVISEDARLVGVIGNEQTIFVNRSRPNGFIMDQWKTAYVVSEIIKPNADVKGGFNCRNKDICYFSTKQNKVEIKILWVANQTEIDKDITTLCESFDLIVLAYAPSTNICTTLMPSTQVMSAQVITAQDLALYGAADVSSNSDNSGLVIRHALPKTSNEKQTRPWNRHRQYSRSARNLAPYERKKSVIADEPN